MKYAHVLFFVSVFLFFSCFTDEKSKESRIYLLDSSSSYNFTGLYQVKDSGSGWGSNRLNETPDYIDDWRVFKFDPGTYDIRVEMAGHSDSPFIETRTFDNEEGVEYDIWNSSFFITEFTFNN